MTAAPKIQHVDTHDSVGTTLRAMGKTAKEAAHTWTIREWAARLATKAQPRDYVGQLAALYNGILQRWRYVQEPGEWVTNTGRAGLAYTLGAKYNAGPSCPSPERCDVANTKNWQRGWGDCDDVSAVVAAGAMALGMTPFFRTVIGDGQGHVSVLVRTPAGQWVSVDPVGHPTQKFGWRFNKPGAQVALFNMDGRQVATGDPDGGQENMKYDPGSIYRTPSMGHWPTRADMARRRGLGAIPDFALAGNRAQAQPSNQGMGHNVLLRPRARAGGRILAMPEWHMRFFRRGMMVNGTPASDQFGEMYRYRADLDAWVPEGSPVAGHDCPYRPGQQLSGVEFGKTYWQRRRERWKRIRKRGKERRKRRTERLKRVGKRIRQGFRRFGKKVKEFVVRVGKKIVRVARAVLSRVLTSKVFQGAACAALQAFGVPMPLCRRLFQAVGTLLREGGAAKLLKLMFQRKWKAIGAILKKVGKDFLTGGANVLRNLDKYGVKLGNVDASEDTIPTPNNPLARALDDKREMVVQYGQGMSFRAAPVVAMVGVIGQVEPDQAIVSPTPEAGRWYRIKKNDRLADIVVAAYGGRSLARQKAINAIRANQNQTRPTESDYYKKHFGDRFIDFRPRYASNPADAIAGKPGNDYALIYLPVENEEPPSAPCGPGAEWDASTLTCRMVVEPTPAPAPEPEPEDEPMPEDEEGEIVVPPEPEPEPAPPEPEPAPEPEPPPPEPPAPPIEAKPLDQYPVARVNVCGDRFNQPGAQTVTRMVPCGAPVTGASGEGPRFSPENDGCIVCDTVPVAQPPAPAPAPEPQPAPAPAPAPAPVPSGPPRCQPGQTALRDPMLRLTMPDGGTISRTYSAFVSQLDLVATQYNRQTAYAAAKILESARDGQVGQTFGYMTPDGAFTMRVETEGNWRCMTPAEMNPSRRYEATPSPSPVPTPVPTPSPSPEPSPPVPEPLPEPSPAPAPAPIPGPMPAPSQNGDWIWYAVAASLFLAPQLTIPATVVAVATQS